MGDVFSNIKVTNPFKDQSVDDLTINLNKSTKPYSILSSIQFNGPSYIFKVYKPSKVFTYGLGISQRLNISSLAHKCMFRWLHWSAGLIPVCESKVLRAAEELRSK